MEILLLNNNMCDTLLLNHDGQPLNMLPPSVIDWQTAIKLVFLNKVVVVKNHDDWVVHSQKMAMPVPSIIMTRRYVRTRNRVQLSRKMIYLRDNYTCQYCGERFTGKDLTLDHVTPKSLGGTGGWNNLVTCCGTCNWLKGAKVLPPLTKPREPNYWQMVKVAKNMPYTMRDPAWAQYLGFEDTELKQATG
jgi:5-methylcytosine-specific restriction endonuclease McrA